MKAKIEELRKDFPEGVDYMIRYDTTPFIRESIEEVFKTLLDSVILVALVVLSVPSELAVGTDPPDRRAGGDHRHFRGHGGVRVFAE